jgi:Transposase
VAHHCFVHPLCPAVIHASQFSNRRLEGDLIIMTNPDPSTQRAVPDLQIYGGVDTHQQFHRAAVVTLDGVELAVAQFDANAAGYQKLTDWLTSHGQLIAVGVESTGCYGADLTLHLLTNEIQVIEVNHPDPVARAGRHPRINRRPHTHRGREHLLRCTKLRFPPDRGGISYKE